MSYQVGDYITNTWTGHAYYGKTGQIVSINPANNGASIDWDGDGVAESGAGVNLSSGSIQPHFGSQFSLQNGIDGIESNADSALIIAMVIGALCIGWLYVRKLVS